MTCEQAIQSENDEVGVRQLMATCTQRYRRVRRGFSLIELLVAVLILGLALISLSQLYLAGMWTTQKARYLSLATQRAQAEMERAQELGILNLTQGASVYPTPEYTPYFFGRGVTFTEDNLPEGRGIVTWSVYPHNTTGNQYLLKVDIFLTWQGAARTRSKVHLTTLLTNRQ